jgi:hypothetical protein
LHRLGKKQITGKVSKQLKTLTMGFNIAGLLVNKKFGNEDLNNVLDAKLSYIGDVDFEDATSSDRDEGIVDVLTTETGTLLFMELGQMSDLSVFPKDVDVIQFMISDVSDTYYFEKYSGGEPVRKYITSQGDVAEDTGEDFINEDDELEEKIWEYAGEYLQNDFVNNMFDMKFKRYEGL